MEDSFFFLCTMSDPHSLRPFLHVIVTLVMIAHFVLFTTERLSHHSLSHYHRGSDIVTINGLCLAGNVEVLFAVFVLFYLRQVVNFEMFRFIFLEFCYLCFIYLNEWTGLCFIKQCKYYDDIT